MKIEQLICLFAGLLCALFQENLTAQTRTLQLNLEGIKYDSLCLAGSDVKDKKVKIMGIRKTDNKWSFSIPDSIYNTLSWYRIQTKLFDDKTKSIGIIELFRKEGMDTIRSDNFYIDQKKSIINARFIKRHIDSAQINVQKVNKVIRVNGFIQKDLFSISSNEDTDWLVWLKYPDFSYFHELSDEEYNKVLIEYSEIVDKYPDSGYLISCLHQYNSKYKSKKDIEKIFCNFSDKIKDSYWGQWINKYLHSELFENTSLPLWNDAASEPIIKDTTKYNLVIFSASWCRPCRKQIPLLKQIYNDLKDRLIFTYVSIDDSTTVKNWKELMVNEQIPWRSLLAVNDAHSICEKYFLQGPELFLVYPNGYKEPIDITEKDQQDKLYKICLQ